MRDQTFKPLGQLNAKFNPNLVGVGWLRGGISITNAEDIATGGDTNGLYVMAAGKVRFTDLINVNILPASALTEPDHTPDGSIWGCQAMALFPGDGNIGIFVMNNIIYKSTNLLSANPTLTKIGGPYPSAYWAANSNGMFAWPKALFDPANSNVFIIGTQSTALLYSTDGGTTINTITVGAPGAFESSPCCHAVGFDPTSTVSGGQHQVWYYSTYGSGVYKSTTGIAGLASASLVTSTPANVNAFKVAANGDVYALNGGESASGNLYKKPVASGSFTKCPGMPSFSFWDVAINPTNINQVIVTVEQATVFAESLDGGATWLGNDIWNSAYPVGMTLTPTSASWMMSRDANGKSTRKPQLTFGGQSGNIEWNHAGTRLYMASGQGLLVCTPPTVWNTSSAAQWNWREVSLGISQAVVSDVYNPPSGNYPLLQACGDFCLMEGNTPETTTSTIPQKTVMTNHFDQTAWSIESAPAPNQDFLVTCAGFWDNVHSYRTAPSAPWTIFSGSFPLGSGVTQGGGVLLPKTPNDIFGFLIGNSRPVSTHDQGATWAYEDVNMPGMITKARGWAGSGNGLMIFTDVQNWTTVQNVRVVVNAASGGGSITISGSNPTIITVVPAAGAASCFAVAAQVNANGPASALVTASYGGTGANAVTTGTYDVNYFFSGWSWVPIFYNEPCRGACLDKTNGDIFAYNSGDEIFGTAAPWAGIWKLPAGSSTWSRVNGCPGGIFSGAGHHLREVLGQPGHGFFHGQRNTPLYRTTNGWASYSGVGDGVNSFQNVLWAHTGKAAANQTYPSIYVAGTLNGTTALWACWDGTWTNWYNYSSILIGGLAYNLNRFFADANVFGKIDGCFYQGAWGGTYDYKSVAA